MRDGQQTLAINVYPRGDRWFADGIARRGLATHILRAAAYTVEEAVINLTTRDPRFLGVEAVIDYPPITGWRAWVCRLFGV